MNSLWKKLGSPYRMFWDIIRRQIPYIMMILVLLGFGLVLFYDRVVISIDSGHAGVLWRRFGGGTVLDTTYAEGIHLILPINKMYVYDTRQQEISETLQVLTADGLPISVTYQVRYYLAHDLLPLMHQRVGRNYVSVVVRPEIHAAIRTIVGQSKPEDLYTSQKAIQEQISALSKVRLEARYVSLDDVLIQSITLPEKITKAIEEKMTYQQQLAEYAFRQKIADAEVARKKTEADGVAQYNQILDQSLTPSVLRWYGITASENLAKSTNAKTVIIGAGSSGLPIILGKD